jgi:hypothetical protein
MPDDKFESFSDLDGDTSPAESLVDISTEDGGGQQEDATEAINEEHTDDLSTDKSEPDTGDGGDQDGEEGGDESQPEGTPDSGDAEGEDSLEGGGEDSSGGDDELTEEDLDPLIPIKINKEDRQLPLSEVVKRAQKYEAANELFQKGAQDRKRAEFFFKQFQEVESSGVGGMPKPIQAMIQCMAPVFGGSKVKAQQYLTKEMLPKFLDCAIKVQDNPDLIDVNWSKHDLKEKEDRLRVQEEEAKRMRIDAEMRERAARAAPLFQAACKDLEIDSHSTEGKKVDKILTERVINGEELTFDACRKALLAVKTESDAFLAERLKLLKAEDLAKINPDLAKKLTGYYAKQIKKSRPTKGQAAGSGEKLSPTAKSQRRKERRFVDTIDELQT